MRANRLCPAVLVLVLALAGCEGSGDGDDEEDAPPVPVETGKPSRGDIYAVYSGTAPISSTFSRALRTTAEA